MTKLAQKSRSPKHARHSPARTPGLAFAVLVLAMSAWPFPAIGVRAGTAQDASARLRVKVSRPLRREVRDDVDLPGRIAAVQSIQMRALVGGRIEKVRVAPGQKVRRGELLLQIDPGPYQESLKKAEAKLQAAQGRLEARRNAAKKAARDARDPGENTRLQAESEAAEAAVATAAKARDIARLDLRFTELTAPFDGMILGPVARAGDVAEEGQTVLGRFVSIGPMLVYFEVPQDLMRTIGQLRDDGQPDLAPGATLAVTAHVEGADAFACKGTLDLFSDAVNPQTNTYMGRATIRNPDGRLKPEMSAPRGTAGRHAPQGPARARRGHPGRFRRTVPVRRLAGRRARTTGGDGRRRSRRQARGEDGPARRRVGRDPASGAAPALAPQGRGSRWKRCRSRKALHPRSEARDERAHPRKDAPLPR